MTTMDPTRDPAADDLFVDIALSEICSERAPPDPRRVLEAGPERRMAAATEVDAAASRLRREVRLPGLLAAALVIGVSTLACFALALGDDEAAAACRDLAVSDRVAADLTFAAAQLIAAPDETARRTAHGAFERLLSIGSPAARSAVRCALIAADLTEAEAVRLARAAIDPELAARLSEAAGWVARDPRRLLGEPLTLDGELISGERFSTASLRGKVVIVHFWASWSIACDYVLPDLLRTRVRHLDERVAIVGVSCDRDPAALRTFLAQHPEMSWPQLFDSENPGWHALATSLGVAVIPRVFLIDAEGVVRSVDAQEDLPVEVMRLLDH